MTKQSTSKSWLLSPILITLSLIATTACAPNVKNDVHKSIEINSSIESKMEWDQSWFNPKNLFSNWHDHAAQTKNPEQFQDQICATLLELEPVKLAVFETNFEDQETQDLLSPCFQNLKQKLDDFYKQQAQQLSLAFPTQNYQRRRTQFNNKIYLRDFSRGYHTSHADLKVKEVIITFDDGPHRTITPQILASLSATNAKAVFFPVGRNAKAQSNLLRQVAQGGHIVGSHTYNHPCLGTASACRSTNKGRVYDLAAAAREISLGHQAVQDALGWVDPFFRFPYGAATNSARQYLKDAGIADFAWNIDSNDWRQQSVSQLLSSTLRQVDNQKRGIILFHDIQRKTSEVMPAFLNGLYDRGVDVVLIAPNSNNPRLY